MSHIFSLQIPLKAEVTQSCLTLCDPMDYTVHGILQARILEWVAFPFSRGSSQPRDQTQVSHLQEDSLPAEPPRKPKNTGVGSCSVLQRVFPTQGLNSFFYVSCIDKQILYFERHLGSLHACALRVNSGQTKKDQKTQLPLLRSLEQKQGAVCAFCTQYHLQDGRSLSPGHPLTCAL